MSKNTYKLELQITKYDPQYRDEMGIYLRDEWTAISQIGDTFEGESFHSQRLFRCGRPLYRVAENLAEGVRYFRNGDESMGRKLESPSKQCFF